KLRDILPKLHEKQEEGHHRQGVREYLDQEQGQEQVAPPGEAKAREGIGAERGDEHGENRGDRRQIEAVPQPTQEGKTRVAAEQDPVISQRSVVRNELLARQ